jgi:hypothetical protein
MFVQMCEAMCGGLVGEELLLASFRETDLNIEAKYGSGERGLSKGGESSSLVAWVIHFRFWLRLPLDDPDNATLTPLSQPEHT